MATADPRPSHFNGRPPLFDAAKFEQFAAALRTHCYGLTTLREYWLAAAASLSQSPQIVWFEREFPFAAHETFDLGLFLTALGRRINAVPHWFRLKADVAAVFARRYTLKTVPAAVAALRQVVLQDPEFEGVSGWWGAHLAHLIDDPAVVRQLNTLGKFPALEAVFDVISSHCMAQGIQMDRSLTAASPSHPPGLEAMEVGAVATAPRPSPSSSSSSRRACRRCGAAGHVSPDCPAPAPVPGAHRTAHVNAAAAAAAAPQL